MTSETNKSNNLYNDSTRNMSISSISSGYTNNTNKNILSSINISSIDLYDVILDFIPMCLDLDKMLFTDSNGTITPISDMTHIPK